ncbi:hypothetical protein PHSY_004658 [Pseudozyma hubeiensis SY62]|uniref:Uncharacterized protein n=1 Tax=Pseudozyma hubeiensis (strain SY62) TaxID=1305764 RepID=R9P6V6_PSEHS|nr:hypothetical protein PHSY_004658 [Pseudozyma hubeiensis SY62]GAC97074.1 hypothetical protein PHSY_004658 [Pseudozyma hubeiensis SY62]
MLTFRNDFHSAFDDFGAAFVCRSYETRSMTCLSAFGDGNVQKAERLRRTSGRQTANYTIRVMLTPNKSVSHFEMAFTPTDIGVRRCKTAA